MEPRYTFYEFFAGAGMARAGLGAGWQCLFANDCDALKVASYGANWGSEHIDSRDVRLIKASDLSGMADLAWASFPCQDLSQAGSKLGVGKADSAELTRSGAVWPFLDIVRDLAITGRQPALLVLENVVGLLSSNSGADFRSICVALSGMNYHFGGFVADAAHFIPQSRPRVFIVALRRDVPVPCALCSQEPTEPWHTQSLIRAYKNLPDEESSKWVWWKIGEAPTSRQKELPEILDLSEEASWDGDEYTERLLSMMSDIQLAKIAEAKALPGPVVGSLYLRMRPNGTSGNIQRAEIALGKTLGCLRTPKGGASRPRIVVVDGERVRTRLVSEREAATLMGLDFDFVLPKTYNEAFRLIGDGVAPPVVRFISERLLEPLASHARGFSGFQN